jgi:hypothetical protein
MISCSATITSIFSFRPEGIGFLISIGNPMYGGWKVRLRIVRTRESGSIDRGGSAQGARTEIASRHRPTGGLGLRGWVSGTHGLSGPWKTTCSPNYPRKTSRPCSTGQPCAPMIPAFPRETDLTVTRIYLSRNSAVHTVRFYANALIAMISTRASPSTLMLRLMFFFLLFLENRRLRARIPLPTVLRRDFQRVAS